MTQIDKSFDATGMRCPIPVLRAAKELRAMQAGEILEIKATDGQAPKDFRDFCNEAGHEILQNEDNGDHYIIVIRKG
jgi:tRNA 2-thiouridine synthesizing protein A